MTPPATNQQLPSAWITTALNSTEWVEATPFRAHLHYLVGSSGLSGRVIAEYCGIPIRLADRLLVVGDGSAQTVRRARRISHACAARLLAVRPADLQVLRWSTVKAAATLRRLDKLVAAGHDLRAIAATVDAAPTELVLLHARRWHTCPRAVALQVAAACRIALPDQETVEPGDDGQSAPVVQVALRAG